MNSFKDSPRRTARTVLIGLIAMSYSASMIIFAYKYVKTIPQQLPHYWHYGRRKLVDKLRPFIDEKRQIYLTNKGGPPYIFLAFYLPISSADFQQTIRRNPVINELGWGHVDEILGITTPREFQWDEIPKEPGALYVGFEDEIPESQVNILDRVYYPNGRPVYTLAKLKQ
jgi:hypothetical protein